MSMAQSRRKFIKNSFLFTMMMSSPWVFSRFHQKHINDEFSAEILMGKGKPELVGSSYKLRKEVAEKFEEMVKAAKKDGFSPHVISSYRSYSHQKRIWDNKFINFTKRDKLSPEKAIEKIIEYSTIPGTSRHHWGTDLDIVDASKGIVDNPLHEKHFNKNGVYYEFKQWLNQHSESFGFYEVYTNRPDRKGFYYEPWHFSFLPTSCKMLREYIHQNLIEGIQHSDIQGSEFLTESFMQEYFKNNILDINEELLP